VRVSSKPIGGLPPRPGFFNGAKRTCSTEGETIMVGIPRKEEFGQAVYRAWLAQITHGELQDELYDREFLILETLGGPSDADFWKRECLKQEFERRGLLSVFNRLVSRISSTRDARSDSLDATVPRPCGFCGGVSRRPSCPACRGRGEVLVAEPAKRCFRCIGTGEATLTDRFPIKRGASYLCSVCRGTGWLMAVTYGNE